jgi:hypothetical protein
MRLEGIEMSTITPEERLKIIKWVMENFDIDKQNKTVRIPTAVENEAVVIPLERLLATVKDAVLTALRNGEDPWIYVANAEMTPPPTTGLKPCAECGGILRTLSPEEHFNQFIRRKAAEKLKIPFLSEVAQWLG